MHPLVLHSTDDSGIQAVVDVSRFRGGRQKCIRVIKCLGATSVTWLRRDLTTKFYLKFDKFFNIYKGDRRKDDSHDWHIGPSTVAEVIYNSSDAMLVVRRGPFRNQDSMIIR